MKSYEYPPLKKGDLLRRTGGDQWVVREVSGEEVIAGYFGSRSGFMIHFVYADACRMRESYRKHSGKSFADIRWLW